MIKNIHFIKNHLKLIIIILFLVFFPSRSYAYLDPGSSSILIQLIIMITIFLSTLHTRIKSFFHKIVSKLKSKSKDKKK